MNTPIEDLFALAEEAIAPAIWTEKKALQKFKESATPDRVREVAKAFRALEQRAEAAEAKIQSVTESRDQWEANAHEFSRCADRLEAKLAELEKQEPVADIVAWSHPHEERTCDIRLRKYDLKPGALFYRPAPAINLAELVPPEADGSNLPFAANGWNACRAEMLRKIEDKAK